MSVIESLTFTSVPRIERDPARMRRERLVGRLREQLALLANPALVRTTERTFRKDGAKTVVERTQRVHPWWRTDDKGQVVFFVRIGAKMVEFEKRKAGIAVGAKEKLPSVIETLISVVEKGELDHVVQAMTQRIAAPKKAA
jgi:hypothetical protein